MVATANRRQGEVFIDARGNDRALRLTWHHECDLVVLSLWKDNTCAGTFRLAREDVGGFVDALVDGLRDAPGAHFSGTALERQAAAKAMRPAIPRHQQAGRPGETFADWAFSDSPGATAS